MQFSAQVLSVVLILYRLFRESVALSGVESLSSSDLVEAEEYCVLSSDSIFSTDILDSLVSVKKENNFKKGQCLKCDFISYL